MTILVYAEHNNKELKSATLSAVTAATQIGADVHVLVAGFEADEVAQVAAKISGVSKVILVNNAAFTHQLAENVAPVLVDFAKDYSHIITATTTTGKNILPRVAALLDVNMASDVVSVVNANTFVRPIYAGNAFATIEIDEEKILLSVRTTAFEQAALKGSATIESVEIGENTDKSRFVAEELGQSERPELTSARVVVSGGRALASAENFAQYINPLADKLSAAVGASRAAVDAGFVPNDMQVGQTGKIVAPELYIAAGISGAIQHLAGMKDSKVIVAINTDPEAPIVQVADYFLQADLFEVLPEMTAKL